MINILVTEENIVNDFLIQFPCRRVINLGQNLSIIKGACPNGQVPFIISESLITPRRLPARRLTDVDYHKYMNLFFYNIVNNMYKFKITHAGKVERSNNNVKIAKNPMLFEK